MLSRFLYLRGDDRFVSNLTNSPKDGDVFTTISMHASLLGSGWASLTVVSILFFTLGTSILRYDASIFNLFWIYFALLVVFFVATSMALWERYRGVFVSAVGVAIIVILAFGPRLGGVALRVLGYGGGIPITFMAKTVDVNTNRTGAERINGCLVLLTGTYITFVQAVEPNVALTRCHLSPRTSHLEDGKLVPTGTHTISRADVTDVLFIGQRSRPSNR